MEGFEPLSGAWERHAGRWERWTRVVGHDVYYEQLNWPAFRALLPPAGRRTLDVGCGEGRAGRALAAAGHRVAGIDSSPTLVGLARAAGGYDELVCGDGAQLPWKLNGMHMTFEGLDRPLEAYTRALACSGFVIEELREPKPTTAALAVAPTLAKAAKRPYFLHMRCALAQ